MATTQTITTIRSVTTTPPGWYANPVGDGEPATAPHRAHQPDMLISHRRTSDHSGVHSQSLSPCDAR